MYRTYVLIVKYLKNLIFNIAITRAFKLFRIFVCLLTFLHKLIIFYIFLLTEKSTTLSLFPLSNKYVRYILTKNKFNENKKNTTKTIIF